LIDFDLVIKEQQEKFSGARGKTGTRAFMTIRVLLDDKQHSFMHDPKSFFFGYCFGYAFPMMGLAKTLGQLNSSVGTLRVMGSWQVLKERD
jgi:hypothetical protein